ncbi:MAG TPA: helix-turn-helix domain-containing protein [Steroidobacteraceae bacterium]|nr:helix-turn-helix domain-containing protein [Steroidobacteraceae bacterium]
MARFPLAAPAARALIKLGRDLSLARRRRRLSQASLAERSGIGINSVRRLEKGGPTGSIEHLARVLQALGEIERLEKLLDSGTDDVGLLMMDDNLPARIRSRKSTGAL